MLLTSRGKTVGMWMYLTVREPTLPVAPATNATALSFELISCLMASPVSILDPVVTCADAVTQK